MHYAARFTQSHQDEMIVHFVTYSECVDYIVSILRDTTVSLEGIKITILKGHEDSNEFIEEHFNLTSWIIFKEHQCQKQ